jgi:hypothetical protein
VVLTVSLVTSFLPIIFFLVFCLKTKERGLWVNFFYISFALLIDIVTLTTSWGSANKYTLWNIFILVEFTFLSYFFYLVIQQRLVRSLIILTYLVFFVIYAFYVNNDKGKFNSFLSAIESVILLIYTLSYFMMIMRPTEVPVKIFNPTLLIVFSILVYLSSTTFLYVIVNNLTEQQFQKYWSINDLANIVCNLTYSFAFILYGYQRKNPPHENQFVDYTSPNDR